jgi:Trk-type K+ transport system membrane component
MYKLIDYTTEILFAIVVLFVLGGLGFLINIDMADSKEFKRQCIEAGMQYVKGSCVR